MRKHTPEQRPHWLDYQIKEVCPWCHKPFSIKGYCSAQIAIDQSKEISALRAQVEAYRKFLSIEAEALDEAGFSVDGDRFREALAATGKENV